ncbi:hypothetical protein [Actinocrispum wychmicini]|uniref:Uncharacterized protein n=1 Tax=Actinocrispum wychmicini TaxID=1213861 RepID=A0A4R2JHW0_9PSEU|nr:hypothetical protein [Actinocrispum wychmicini]TCO55989.1 hypothetical protein EV192_107414 [Actinocrispum wychmicini]
MSDNAATRPRAGNAANLLTVLFSTWLLGGVLADVLAHNNIRKLETFFTPWHAALYSGFLATAAWVGWIVRRNLMAGRRGFDAIPTGYGLGVAGVALFLVAGAGDLAWHTIFGIEQNTRILFSPTHLLLITALSLIFTSPLRDALTDPAIPDAPSTRRLLPAMLGLAFAGAAIMVLLQYGNMLLLTPDRVVDALDRDGKGSGASSVALELIVTNVALLFPLLIIGRRWTIPFGTATIMYAVFGVQAAVLRTPMVLVTVVLCGLGVDLLAMRLRPGPSRRRAFWAFGALAPVVTWAVFFAVGFIEAGRLPGVVEFWTGMPVVAGLLGLLFAALLLPGAGALGGAGVEPAVSHETTPTAR